MTEEEPATTPALGSGAFGAAWLARQHTKRNQVLQPNETCLISANGPSVAPTRNPASSAFARGCTGAASSCKHIAGSGT